MATVVVTVKERIATIPSGVSLVCNNPSDVIQFNFDSEWDSITLKTRGLHGSEVMWMCLSPATQ